MLIGTAAFELEPVDEEDEPELVPDALEPELDVPVLHSLRPLMMPCSCAAVNFSQMAVLSLVVTTVEPPRTSLSLSMATLGQCQYFVYAYYT